MTRTSRLASLGTLAVIAGLLSSGTAHAQWNVTVQNLFGADTPTATTSLIAAGATSGIDNIAEATALLNNGGAAEATDSPSVIHYLGAGGGSGGIFPAGNTAYNAGAVPFPTGSGSTEAGNGTQNFALRATSLVTVTGGPSAQAYLYVTSDDGFRVDLNGNFAFGFDVDGANYDTDTLSPLMTFSSGDVLTFTYYERTGGEFAYIFSDADGDKTTELDRTLLTSQPTTGITFVSTAVVPEAGTLALFAPALLGGIVLVARRRK